MRQELISKINQLKKERNAVIVAHSYINDEIQGMADIVGDSYALSKYCAEQKDADVIVFCGVHFMAESAKILSPEKIVLLPEINAGCPMADMVTKEALIERKKQLPDAAVVCYINTSAAVKAECDICCTSSNAINIVSKIENDRILFVPDKNLARNVAVRLPQKQIIPWEGYCPAHNDVKLENIIKSKERYPNAKILVHPECTYEVCALADFVGSTKEIIEFATESEYKEFVIVTEMGVMYSLRRDNPNKKFYFPEEQILCENMKITTPESVYRALKENKYEIQLDKVTIEKARNCLEKMLELGK